MNRCRFWSYCYWRQSYADKCEHDAYYCTEKTMMRCYEGLQFLVAEQASDNAALQERCNELEKRIKEFEERCNELEKRIKEFEEISPI